MVQTILLADDESAIMEINQRYLKDAGYVVLTAADGAEALNVFKHQHVDLVITDIMMPNMDGYDLIDEVQLLNPDQPFLFITAKTSDQDKIFALNLGADDFISKPFSPRELVLRVGNILRRINGSRGQQDKTQLGNLRVDYTAHEATVKGQTLDLTAKDFELLWLLAGNPRHVFSKTELYQIVWGEAYLEVDANTLNVHIHALRAQLCSYGDEQTPTIKTVWGLGYKIEV
ncbi:response regulator transcription factor [Lacticaseibacillus mingshuiensis]|uniref:Response regulator transcription factor n=1 Tax=Lacticaseibacillus mingshuiensis TaxID=2799574 RepID=A0ABW4CJG4_9LACO|nr:response regulator transcription factor [Lacticaseibacillus mingshuiensis]